MKIIITIILCICAGGAYATLTDEEVQRLTWLSEQGYRSYDMDAYVQDPSNHIEVARAAAKIECLELLRIGDRKSYNKFVRSQSSDILSFATFRELSQYVQNLDAAEYAIVRKAIILTAVSLSTQARNNYPAIAKINDRLDFTAEEVRENSESRMLYIIFPPKTNFRHMLYAEGGSEMFVTIRNMIQHRYMQQAELDLWFAYWIVDMSGFRGHVNKNGSKYLGESVSQAMLTLKGMLDQMLLSPNYDVLSAYLEYRSHLLGFSELPLRQRITLAHLGSMLRLYNPDQGRVLYKAFVQLPSDLQSQTLDYFNDEINQRSAPTHACALFCNSLAYTNQDIESVIAKVLPIYLQGIRANDSHVSFNLLSSSDNIRKIFSHDKIRLVINSANELVILQQ